jgi:Zn-dependent peptidase ImmA (M78 family)
MRVNSIETKATAILDSVQNLSFPIDVEDIALKRGLIVLPHIFDDSISGMLMVKDGIATIAYNASHPPVRKRFTIAHELGHYELHRSGSSLFLDKQVLLRSQHVSDNLATQKMEREANAFAAAILMPEKLLKQEIFMAGLDIHDEDTLKEIAKNFGVSTLAMYFRLSNLGFI